MYLRNLTASFSFYGNFAIYVDKKFSNFLENTSQNILAKRAKHEHALCFMGLSWWSKR